MENFMDPIDALGELAKSAGRVQAGHKYKRRRRGSSGRWEYDYGNGWGKPAGKGKKAKKDGDGRSRTHTYYGKLEQQDIEKAYAAAHADIEKYGVESVSRATLVVAHEGHDWNMNYFEDVLYNDPDVRPGQTKTGVVKKLRAQLKNAKSETKKIAREWKNRTGYTHVPSWGEHARTPSPPDKKAEKSMDSTKTINPEILSKGLHSFYDHDGKMKKVKDDWLADYADAFFEEAFEHERQESMHRDPNLMPVRMDPTASMNQAVYNEFIAMCAHNKNLARAKQTLNVTEEYVAARLRDCGLVHVASENHEAMRNSAVAGYHPTPMALSQDGFAAAQREEQEAKAQMGQLVKGEEFVRFGDADNPFNALADLSKARVNNYHEQYGHDAPVQDVDSNCLLHGRDLLKAGLPHVAVHGAVCTCPSNS